MKKTWTSMLAVAVMLFSAAFARAQDTNTVAVVSISSYDNLLGSIATIGETAGKPGLDQMINALLTLQTGGKGLVGVDKTKPWGVQVVMTEQGPGGIMFIPVTDLKALLGALSNAVGEAEDVGDGVLALANGPAPTFIKEQNNWAFIAQSKEQLATLPADPAKLLDGLDKDYTVAARAFIQNIPEPMRQMAVEQMRGGFEGGLQRLDGESDEDFKLRKQAAESSIKQLERMINETETLTIGWAVDMANKQTYVDIAQTAVPGTMLAKQMASYKPTTSEFAGFIMEGAAFSMHINAKSDVTDADKASMKAQIDTLRERAMAEFDKEAELPEEAKKQIKEAFGDIFDVLADTAMSGKYDGGAVVMGNPMLNAVAGGHVADGKKIEEALKKIGKVAAEDPDAPKINWDSETHSGYNFHNITMPAPDDDARRLLGDNMQIAAAASKNGVLVAVGSDAVGSIKKVIDASAAAASKELPVMQVVISLGEVMKIAQKAQPDDQNVAMMAAMLGQMKGNDRVLTTATNVKNGINYRMSVDEGVIKMIGAAAANMGAGGPGGPGGF